MEKTTKASTGIDLVKGNKLVFKVVQAIIMVLIIFILVKLGFCMKTFIGIAELICTSIATLLGYKLAKTEESRAVAIVVIPAFAGNIYSILMGGSTTAFTVNYVIIGLALMFFDKEIYKKIIIPLIIFDIVLIFVYPAAIEGPGGRRIMALVTVLVFCIGAFSFKQAIDIGSQMSEKAFSNLKEMEEHIEKSNEIIKDFNGIVVDAQQSSVDILDGSNDINDATKEIDVDVNEIALGMGNIKESVEQVDSLIERDINISDELKTRYEDVVGVVGSGMKDIDETLEVMNKMENAINGAHDITYTLVDYMEKIDKILENITNISSQTKLLALNASIEAARAGEKGKGFDVVAEEISSLSNESAIASKNIKEIIELINATVEDVNSKIEEGVTVSRIGYNELIKIADILKGINETSMEVEQIIKKEGELVRNIERDFSYVPDKLKKVINMTDENLLKLNNIDMSVKEQNQSIRNYDTKIEDIRVLANEMVTEL